jgi:hypothetical protein
MALYSVATWDTNKQAYTPQCGLSVPSFNITLSQLRVALKELRQMGYTAHRVRHAIGTDGFEDYDHDSDPSVLVERTDGKHWKEIMKDWRR